MILVQAIAITAFGGPDQLKLVDLPGPTCRGTHG